MSQRIGKLKHYTYTICETGAGGLCRCHGIDNGLLSDGTFYPKTQDLEQIKKESIKKLNEIIQYEKPKEHEKLMIRINCFVDDIWDCEYRLIQGTDTWFDPYQEFLKNREKINNADRQDNVEDW